MSVGAWVKRGAAALAPGAAIVKGRADSGAIALTFDDGPNPDVTPRLLDALDRLGIRVTFFLIGQQARSYPSLVREIDARGHQVASHGYAHLDARHVSASVVVDDADRAHSHLEDILGRAMPRDYRPPYGTVNVAAFARMALKGYRYVFWSLDSRDAFCKTPQELCDLFETQTVRAGDILLLHDDYPLTVDAMPSIVDRIRSVGLRFDRIDGSSTGAVI